MTNLQHITTLFVTLLGESEGLFGMELAGNSWTEDGSNYYPKHKPLSDFTEEECIATLEHIHEWLTSHIDTKEKTIKDLRDIVKYYQNV